MGPMLCLRQPFPLLDVDDVIQSQDWSCGHTRDGSFVLHHFEAEGRLLDDIAGSGCLYDKIHMSFNSLLHSDW